MAKVIARELEPYHLYFIEEPVLPENNEALREIAAHTSTPIATGERMFSRWDFKPLLHDGYADIFSRICRTRAAFPKSSRSRRWPKPTT